MSRVPVPPSVRKARQRARENRDGFKTVEVRMPREVAECLEVAADLCGSSLKFEAYYLVKHFAERHKASVEKQFQRAGNAWIKALPFLPYVTYFSSPSASFIRVVGRTLTVEEWKPINDEITAIYNLLHGQGWDHGKIMAFFKRAASSQGATHAEVSQVSDANLPTPLAAQAVQAARLPSPA